MLLPLALLASTVASQCVSQTPRPWTAEEQRVMAASRAREKEGILVGDGTQKVVTVADGIRSVKVADPDLVEARALGTRQLLVVGIDLGRSSITYVTAKGAEKTVPVTVERSDIDVCAWQNWLRWLTPDTKRTPRFKFAGDHVRWVGDVDSIDDYLRLRNLAAAVGRILIFDVHPSAHVIADRMDRLNGELYAAGLEHVHARWAANDVALDPVRAAPPNAVADETRAAAPFVKAARDELR